MVVFARAKKIRGSKMKSRDDPTLTLPENAGPHSLNGPCGPSRLAWAERGYISRSAIAAVRLD